MELTPQERQRIYEEEKARIEVRQQLEAQMGISADNHSNVSKKTVYSSSLSTALSYLGVTLAIVGIAAVVYYGFLFSTVVPIPKELQQFAPTSSGSVNNIGLISDRQNGMMFGGISAVIGTGLFITGLVLNLNTSKYNSQKLARGILAYSVILCLVAGTGMALATQGGPHGYAARKLASQLNMGPDPNDAIAKDRLLAVGLRFIEYAAYHEGKFPEMDSSDHAMCAVEPPMDDIGAGVPEWKDPSSGEKWAVNEKFTGFNSLDERHGKYSQNEIIAYAPEPKSDGWRWCLFADGHAKQLNKEQWEKAQTTSSIKVDPQLGFSDDYTMQPL